MENSEHTQIKVLQDNTCFASARCDECEKEWKHLFKQNFFSYKIIWVQ